MARAAGSVRRWMTITGATLACGLAAITAVAAGQGILPTPQAAAEESSSFGQSDWQELQNRLVQIGMPAEKMPDLTIVEKWPWAEVKVSDLTRATLFQMQQEFVGTYHFHGKRYSYTEFLPMRARTDMNLESTIIDRCHGNFYYVQRPDAPAHAAASTRPDYRPPTGQKPVPASRPEQVPAHLAPPPPSAQERAAFQWIRDRGQDPNADENFCRHLLGKPLIETS